MAWPVQVAEPGGRSRIRGPDRADRARPWAWGQDMSVGFFCVSGALSPSLRLSLSSPGHTNLLVSLAERLDQFPNPKPLTLCACLTLCLCLGLWLGVWDYGWRPSGWEVQTLVSPNTGICESGLWLATLSYEKGKVTVTLL